MLSAMRHAVLVACLLATAAPAQRVSTSRSAPETPERRAQQLVRLMELPERRHEAFVELLRLGPTGAGPLTRALSDPRPDVVRNAAWMLVLLDEHAASALPELRRVAAKGPPEAARPCKWALGRLEFRGSLRVDYTKCNVLVLGEDGKEKRALQGLRGPWHAEPVGSGHLLVSEYDGNRVSEFDDRGTAVWTFGDLVNPYDAERLPDGNTLIADGGGGRIVEVDPGGEVVWKAEGLGRPVDVQRLPDGHTLVADFDGGRVVELAPDGKIVREIKDLPRVMDVDLLQNGNLLVALFESGIVREVDPRGRTVTELQNVRRVQDADRLPNGHTLVAATQSWIEFDEKGAEIWRSRAAFACEILRR